MLKAILLAAAGAGLRRGVTHGVWRVEHPGLHTPTCRMCLREIGRWNARQHNLVRSSYYYLHKCLFRSYVTTNCHHYNMKLSQVVLCAASLLLLVAASTDARSKKWSKKHPPTAKDFRLVRAVTEAVPAA